MSISIEIMIVSFLFLWLHGLNRSKKQGPYSRAVVCFAWIVARGVPFLMLQEKTVPAALCLLADLAVYGMLDQADRSLGNRGTAGEFPLIWAFTPLGIFASFRGSPVLLILASAGSALLFAGVLFLKKKNIDVKALEERLHPAWMGFSVGTSLLLIVISQDASVSLNGTDENWQYMVLAAAILVMTLSAVYGLLLFIGKVKPRTGKFSQLFDAGSENERKNKKHPEGITWLALAAMVVVYGVLVLNQLGSHEFPNSAMKLGGDETPQQIILEVGNRELIGIDVCLGRKQATLSFSSFDEEKNEWDVFDSMHVFKSYYAWEEADSVPEDPVSRLGIVSQEKVSYIQELVLLDENGEPFLPENADEYPELFDEQAMWNPDRSYYDRTMFDEIYYTRTAQEILDHETIYETSHPPMGKNIIALAESYFGNNPFGWRIVPAICGMFSILFVFGIAWTVLRHDLYSLAAAALYSAEFMHMTLSRICTIDIIVAFFVLGMFFFMIRFCVHDCPGSIRSMWNLLACGIFMGFAASTKWTGIYGAAGVAVMFFVSLFYKWGSIRGWDRKKTIRLAIVCVLCFMVIPFVIYTASYLTYEWVPEDHRNVFEIMTSNFSLMLNYHSKTVFEHPYASEWYTWLIDRTSLMDALTGYQDGKISLVVTFGNPLICWAGLLSVGVCFLLAFRDRDHRALLLLIMYASMLVPWWFIHRTVFIYQYYISLSILPVTLIYSISRLKKKPVRKWTLGVVLVGSIALFLLFYPILTGIPVEESYIRELRLISETWRFGV